MANHLQSKKRIRQTIKRNERNAGLRTTMRRTVKNVRTAVEAGDKDKATEALKIAVKTLDKSVTKNVMKRKTASRTISRLTKAVGKI